MASSPTIDPATVDEALDAVLAASLRSVCVGLALLYALLTGWYLIQYDGAAQTNLGLSTGLFSLGLLAAAVWFERNRVPLRWVGEITAGVAAAIVFHCLFVLISITSARQTTNLMIAQLGFGCLLLSLRWYLAISLASLAGWSFIAQDHLADPDWRHFGLALMEAVFFGGLVLFVRVRAYRNIQELHVRDRRLMQELRDANHTALCAARAKAEFLANMSHEIRTPMTAMLGMTELLQLTRLDTAQAEYASTIERSGRILLQIVNDILDFSKIEAGRVALEEVSFDLELLLRDVRALLEHEARAKDLPLLLEIQTALPLYRGDPTRIKQILINLVGNALKFTKRGEVKLCARSLAHGTGGWADVEIAIEDTGIGIPEAQQQRVFEAFTQADASTTRRYGGTGLGLAISSRLAVLMGGRLRLTSTPNVGSTFTLQLQLPIVDRRSMLSLAAASEVPTQYHGHILLVEDTVDTQVLAQHMLVGLGCEVDIASDGLLALAYIERTTYDLILMDCHMPNLNGYETTREIRRRERDRGTHIPIVALSASVLPEEREQCLHAGMDDYVAKPFSRGDLQRVLRRWLLDPQELTSAPRAQLSGRPPTAP